jgi:hypothetical protein
MTGTEARKQGRDDTLSQTSVVAVTGSAANARSVSEAIEFAALVTSDVSHRGRVVPSLEDDTDTVKARLPANAMGQRHHH